MKKWTILLLALLCSTAGAAAQDFSVVNPRCEYRDEPLGINTLTPRFSWQISARDRGFLQTVCERFKRLGIRVSIFVDPVAEMVRGAAACGADRVELYTEAYARE